MMKCVSVLGSTGSIGRQSLDIISRMPEVKVAALTAGTSVERMAQQCREFRPELAVMATEEAAGRLKNMISDLDIRVAWGEEGLIDAATIAEVDCVITAVVGMLGLKPTLAAIRAGKRIGLANKETLVTAGDIVMAKAKDTGSEIIPVDSEHSAIFQSLAARVNKENYETELNRIILTASGGPFFGKTKEELQNITVAEALNHPNWSMGAKITVDSATLMNKGLEVLEAKQLFAVPIEKVSVLVHRQSIVHSMVEFADNAVIAQLGTPDMKLPIQYALTYPERLTMEGNKLDLTQKPLTFDLPDMETFRCLKLAICAGKQGGTMPTVLNGANEAAVSLFLQGKLGFLAIADAVEAAMQAHEICMNPTLEDIFDADLWAREYVFSKVHTLN